MDSMLCKLQGVLFTQHFIEGQLSIRGGLKKGQRSNYDITTALEELSLAGKQPYYPNREQELQESC